MLNKQKDRGMKRATIFALSALYIGCPTWIGLRADDTEIYINKVPAAQTPNVLFSIDTSGSMDSNVPEGGQTRMEAVKDALSGLINDTSNLKAGLGRFHRELGGPIIFPVVNLDETPDFLDDSVTVSSIDRSSDDAEELGGTVLLDGNSLELTEVRQGELLDITEIEAQPWHSSDDDEVGNGGSVKIDSVDIDDADSGIRFRNIAVPPGATILHAEMEFVNNQNSANKSHKIIHGENVDDAPAFSNGGPNSVQERFGNKTSANMPWRNISEKIDSGDQVTTPNIHAIVQEIVNRAGWKSGNDMVMFLENIQDNHELSSYDGDMAPILRIKYVENATVEVFPAETSQQTANERLGVDIDADLNGFYLLQDPSRTEFTANITHAGLIFPDVDVPDPSKVVWADIQFLARFERSADAAAMEVHGIDEPALSGFSAGNLVSAQTTTSAQVDWLSGLPGLSGPVRGDEEIFAPAGGEPMFTPNLATLVEEMRGNGSFDPLDNTKNNIGFVFTDGSTTGVNQRTMCSSKISAANCPEDANEYIPALRLVYGTPDGASSLRQEVGLRFNNVRVPQGATIESAHIELTVAGETNDPGTLKIEIENNTEPKTFSNNTDEKVSDRGYYTGESVEWDTSSEPWDTLGETKQSPDISSLVSQVTNQDGWCGGGSLAFRLSSEDAKQIAEAWDAGGSGAPALRIDYDASNLSAGEGCTSRQLTVPINDPDDDVEESDNGWIYNNGDLDIESGWTVGLRFNGVDIPLGAEITSTNLLLVADDPNPDSGLNEITVCAQQHPNAPPFSGSRFNVTNRDRTCADVWSEDTTWIEGNIYSPQDDGVDLTDLIQGIIDGTVVIDNDGQTETWASGNALVFTLASNSNNDRDAEVCCNQADPPASLEIFYKVKLGDLAQSGVNTGRQALLSIIDDLVANGWTPPVDAMYEAAAYFKSEPVHFGRTRGAGKSYETSGTTDDDDLDAQIAGHTDAELLVGAERSRLSHFATYTPQDADIVRDPDGDCSENNPNDPDCATEHIDNGVSATYVSPFENAEACERGFLVLLSDGIANRNSSRELIKEISGKASCDMKIPNIDSNGDVIIDGDGSFNLRDPSSDEMCGLDLTDYLHANDFIDEPGNPNDVLNNVRTFTIGFDLEGSTSAVEFLKALAFVGNGGNLDDPEGVDGVRYGDGFYTANNAEQLQAVFETIINEIIDDTTSFVAPGISINAFNRLFNLDDIYFSLFRPDDNVAWLGNLKKFKLCTDQPGCAFGETIDQLAQPAVHDNPGNLDTFGTLKESSYGFWSEAPDSAPDINAGGAGALIPTYNQRNVYIHTSDGAVPDPDFDDHVKIQGTAPHKVDLSTDTDDTPGDPDDYNALKSALLASNNCDTGNPDMDAQNDCLNELIEWITGKRFAGDPPRDNSDENDADRWAFGDPMHSRPLVLTYGKDSRVAEDPDDDTPLSKIFVGTNDGGIRMINEGDGIEEWIFLPNSMLGIQSALKENAKGAHEYGIDDTPTARIKDSDGDGVIEPDGIEPDGGDFVHIFFGLRRGGRQVFALNVTPDSTIGLDSQQTLNAGTDNEFKISIGEKGKIAPEILWRIDGTDPKFDRLGQTWSTPRPVRVAGNSGARSVLIFGGGYDTAAQDGSDNDGISPDGGDKYTGSGGSAPGNAIFMVDADTGERLWWASSYPDGNGDNADANVPAMNTSIAAPVTMLDSSGDGLIDRLYAVDLRGQVFRVDIAATSNPADGESEFSSSTVGVLARLGSDAANDSRRKFLYAPEVARVRDESLTGESYELVGIVSGNRAQPQGRTVQDRAYGIRDFLIENPVGGLSSSNYPECDTTKRSSCPSGGQPLSHDQLQDVTDKDEFVIRNEDGSINAASESVVDALKESHGWFFDLEGDTFDDPTATELTGEKGFSSATVLDGKMFFTTFLPPEETVNNDNACSAPEVLGTSRFYAVDFFTGAPAFDRNDDGSFDKGERFKDVGAGPSADIIPAYLPGGVILPVPTGAGAIAEDPEISATVNKTFWLEER